jgi:hypothetical protein
VDIQPANDPVTGGKIFAIPDGVGVGGYSYKKVRRFTASLLKNESLWELYKVGKKNFAAFDTNVAIVRGFDDNIDQLDLPGNYQDYVFEELVLLKEGGYGTIISRHSPSKDIVAVLLGNTAVAETGAFII